MFNPKQPYNDLPLLPPNGYELESKEILKKTISASRALSKLAGSAGRLPNQGVLLSTVALQEARLSSEIENVVTTNDELFQALATDQLITDPAMKEVLHYQDALWSGYEYVVKKGFLNTSLFIKLYQIIKESSASIRSSPTSLRKTNNNIVYTPPVGEHIIRDKLKNLEDFIHDDNGFDPLVKMSVMHYQFEAIHPFADGNGRTGRILNILYLVKEGLIQVPILYHSRYILKHKNEYYRKLRAVTEKNEWQEWILYMLAAIEQTAAYTQHKIDEILNYMLLVKNQLKERVPEIYSKELLEVLFSLPYCKRKFLEERMDISLKTAGYYLNKLEAAGFLKSRQIGREKLYMNRDFLDVLRADTMEEDAFAKEDQIDSDSLP
jgi:Fic family protein